MRQDTWPEVEKRWSSKSKDLKDPAIILETRMKIDVTTWQYDGVFQCSTLEKQISYTSDSDEPFIIRSLPIYPVAFAGDQLKTGLKRRGEKFWKRRRRSYVCYNGWDFDRTEQFVSVPHHFIGLSKLIGMGSMICAS
jgi:hypothetical protein